MNFRALLTNSCEKKGKKRGGGGVGLGFISEKLVRNRAKKAARCTNISLIRFWDIRWIQFLEPERCALPFSPPRSVGHISPD